VIPPVKLAKAVHTAKTITLELIYSSMREEFAEIKGEIVGLKEEMRALAVGTEGGGRTVGQPRYMNTNTNEKENNTSTLISPVQAMRSTARLNPEPLADPGPPVGAMEIHKQAMDKNIKKIASRMFEMLDNKDGYQNGVISIEEAVNFVRKSSNNHQFVPTAELMKKRYDIDGSGAIDINEFTAIVQDVYTAKQEAELQKSSLKGGDTGRPGSLKMSDFNFKADDDIPGPVDDETEAWNKKDKKKYKILHFLRAQEAVDPNSSTGFYTTITTMVLLLYGTRPPPLPSHTLPTLSALIPPLLLPVLPPPPPSNPPPATNRSVSDPGPVGLRFGGVGRYHDNLH
jgi:Ca2+-binding EF-hand superfamily protein